MNEDRKIPVENCICSEEVRREIEAFNRDVDQHAGMEFARLSAESAPAGADAEKDPAGVDAAKDLEGTGAAKDPAGADAANAPAGTGGDPVLQKLEAVWGAADGISLINQTKHRRSIGLFSVGATMLTAAFLLYDEVYLYWMVLLCTFLLLALFGINYAAKRMKCHRKYLEYRILAETLRVQWYLRMAGLDTKVAELLPWTIQSDMPWIRKVLEILTEDSAQPGPRRSVREIWILDQKNYHASALKKTVAKAKRNDRIVITAVIAMVITYAGTMVFEICWGGLFSGNVRLTPEQLEFARMILKVLMGTMSAATLFAGNYYGKLSLNETAADHRRMIDLFALAEERIRTEGETEQFLRRLAREELAENSSWYAYQSMNKPELSL